MGYKLYREVKRHAPRDLDTGELALLLILADEADEDTRECFPGMDELCAYMRMGADGIGRILQRLAKRGLEVRVVVDKDRIGRPVYAKRGMRTTYRLPWFTVAEPAAAMAGPQSDQGLFSPDHSPAKEQVRPDAGPAKNGVRPDCGPPMAGPQSGPSPQFPQEEDPHLLPHRRYLQKHGIKLNDEEEKSLIDYTTTIGNTGFKRSGWWRKVDTEGDLLGIVASWRGTRTDPSGTSASSSLPPWCGKCGDDNPAAQFNPRFRYLGDGNGYAGSGEKCPDCHPGMVGAA